MKIRAIHIDDEHHALENLKILSAMFCPNLEIIASTTSSFEGIQLINKWKPNVLFLDISMQGHTGFDFLKSYNSKDFEVVFLTAYKEYIHDAIKINAFDYILKPIDENELIRVVEKLQNKMKDKWLGFSKYNEVEKISVNSNSTIDFIEVKDIIYLKADNNYTIIHKTSGEEILTSQTLKKLELELEKYSFFIRIHHSYIVNTNYVSKLLKEDNGLLLLNNGFTLPISRRKKKEVYEKLN